MTPQVVQTDLVADTSARGWWEVDVVLRRAATTDADDEAIREVVRQSVAGLERPNDDRAFDGVHETSSYDMTPPEDSVGVSFWLRAESPGAAVDAAEGIVQAACLQVLGTVLPVWDLRLLPLEAVLARHENLPPAGRPGAFRTVERGFLRRLLGRP